MIPKAVTTNDQLHDLRAPIIDCGDFRLGRLTADRILIHEPGTAMELQSLISDTLLQFGCFELGSRGILSRERASIKFKRRLFDKTLFDIELFTEFFHLELGILHGCQRLTKHFTFLHEVRGQIPGQLCRC